MPIAISLGMPIERTLAAWMIAGSRVTGLLVVAPFLGSAAVPALVRLERGGIIATRSRCPLVSVVGR